MKRWFLLALLAASAAASAQSRTPYTLVGDCNNADVGATVEVVCTINLTGRYDALVLTLETADQDLDQLCIKIETTANTDCDYGPTSASPDSTYGAYTNPQGWLFAAGHDGGADCDQLTTSDGVCKLQFTGLLGVRLITVSAAAAMAGAAVTGTFVASGNSQ